MAAPQFFTPPIASPPKSKRRFTLAQANKALPLVSRIVADIVAAHTAATTLQVRLETLKTSREQNKAEKELEDKLERLQSLVDELGEVGCELKDYQSGLVDFVGRHQGREIYLCWKLGEGRIGYWHELQTGFAGRKPVSELRESD